jgi:DNA-directed RNA polymerase subunit RPC12/RpoP
MSGDETQKRRTATMTEKTCAECGKTYMPTGHCQRRCKECADKAGYKPKAKKSTKAAQIPGPAITPEPKAAKAKKAVSAQAASQPANDPRLSELVAAMTVLGAPSVTLVVGAFTISIDKTGK